MARQAAKHDRKAEPSPRGLEPRDARTRLLGTRAHGFRSLRLEGFVVTRIDPLRFQRGGRAEFDATVDRMLAAARRFDAAKIDAGSIARSGGPPED